MAESPVIVLEFNELTSSIIDRFVADGDLPNFAKFRSESRVFTTVAAEQPPALEPWIQWVTVHTGMSFADHNVFRLNEGHKLAEKRTWEVVAETGRPVWVCGSMNVRSTDHPGVSLLPDPWCTKVSPAPQELGSFFRFVQQNVLEHTNDRVPLTRADYLEFLWFMMRRGLSLSSVTAIVRQLLNEKRGNLRWKRVVLLDLLQFDVFAHYFARRKPLLSTFFLNSTAHYQHAYWDSMAPEQFTVAPDTARAQYRDAIRFGYQQMDRLLNRFMDIASSSQATLVLCTALSQQPSPDYDKSDGGVFYRPRNIEHFAKQIGITDSFQAQPVMSEQYYLEFSEPSAACRAAEALQSPRLDGRGNVMAVRLEGPRVFTGCRIHDSIPEGASFVVGGKLLSFFDWFYRMDTGKTGVHHPNGIFWVRKPDLAHREVSMPVPLTSVAPTILNLLGVPAPAHMKTPALSLA